MSRSIREPLPVYGCPSYALPGALAVWADPLRGPAASRGVNGGALPRGWGLAAPLGVSLAIAIRGVTPQGCERRSGATIASDPVAPSRFWIEVRLDLAGFQPAARSLGPSSDKGAVLFQPVFISVAMIEPAAHDRDCNDQNNRDDDCPHNIRVHGSPNARTTLSDSIRFPDGGVDGSRLASPLLTPKWRLNRESRYEGPGALMLRRVILDPLTIAGRCVNSAWLPMRSPGCCPWLAAAATRARQLDYRALAYNRMPGSGGDPKLSYNRRSRVI
jgi:hypothetical protein